MKGPQTYFICVRRYKQDEHTFGKNIFDSLKPNIVYYPPTCQIS